MLKFSSETSIRKGKKEKKSMLTVFMQWYNWIYINGIFWYLYESVGTGDALVRVRLRKHIALETTLYTKTKCKRSYINKNR